MTAKRKRELLLLVLAILFLGLFLTASFLWIFAAKTASDNFSQTCLVFLILVSGLCALATARCYTRYKFRFRILRKEAEKRRIRIRRKRETEIPVSVGKSQTRKNAT